MTILSAAYALLYTAICEVFELNCSINLAFSLKRYTKSKWNFGEQEDELWYVDKIFSKYSSVIVGYNVAIRYYNLDQFTQNQKRK